MFGLCARASLSKNVPQMNFPVQDPPPTLNRREFLSATTVAAAGVLVGASALAQVTEGKLRKRYALVGVGGRSGMYRDAVKKLTRNTRRWLVTVTSI